MDSFQPNMSMQYKAVQVELLDGSDLARSIYKKTTTMEILENTLQTLNIVEKDYFGLYYLKVDTNERVWLKEHKTIWSQIVKVLEPPYHLYFGVKFYPLDPLLLKEDITLYLIYLQCRREVKEDRVICTTDKRAEILAYILQAEGGDYGGDYIHKHRNFFLNIHNSSPDLETAILEAYKDLKGTDPSTCETRLMENVLPITYYNQEMHNVTSDAQPNLKQLIFTLAPTGIGLYQGTVKLDLYGWMEIWNIGYINRTFWFRIMRNGEKSKHKFHFDDKDTCKHVWNEFREYFRFYTQERKIDLKLLWGRTPPKVKRVNLNIDQTVPTWSHFGVGTNMPRENIIPSYAGISPLPSRSELGMKTQSTEGPNLTTFTPGKTLSGTGPIFSLNNDLGARKHVTYSDSTQREGSDNADMDTGQASDAGGSTGNPRVPFSDSSES